MKEKERLKNLDKKIERLKSKIDELHSELDELIPYAVIKETAPFGNSAHVVLSKEMMDRKVGVIVFGKGGDK